MTPPSDFSLVALSPEDRQRVEQVERLARSGKEGIATLIELLDDKSWAVRRAVVAALARVGDDAIAPLCEIVSSKRSNEARLAAAVDALAASSGDVLRSMLALTDSATAPQIICDALQVIGRRKEAEGLPLVVDFASHEDDNVAVAAIEAMGRLGGRSTVEPLLEAVRQRNFFRTFPAIDALGRTGDPRAVEPLAELLEDPLYAPEAARALGRTGQASAIAALGPLLGKRSDALVRTAALALVDLAHHHEVQFGSTTSIAAALRSAGPGAIGTSRVWACLGAASPSEQLALVRVLGWLGDELAIGSLIALLEEEGPVSRAAGDALRAMGETATPHLLAALAKSDSGRRARLLPLVGTAAGAAASISACLDDPDAEVRARACEALARAADTSVVPELFRLLGDPDARVSTAASSAIQSLGSVETKRLALIEARSHDPRARRAALRIISYFGYAEGLSVLVEAASDDDERIREAAIAGLPLIDDARAIEALVDASTSTSTKTRGAAIRALGSTSATASVVARLRRALEDVEPWVRYYACQSLAKLRVHDAADAIIDRIRDEAGQVRVAAIDALAHLRNESARGALEHAANDDDVDIRRAALLALGTIRHPSALPLLRSAATSSDAATRLVAVSALAEFDLPEIVPLLAHAMSDPSENVRAAAIGFLSTRPGDAATKALIDRLDDEPSRERILAALAVAPVGRVEAILAALETAGDTTAPLLISALVKVRRLSGFAAVAAALSFENVAARRAAAAALAALGTREAVDALRRVGLVDLDPEVQRIALGAQRLG